MVPAKIWVKWSIRWRANLFLTSLYIFYSANLPFPKTYIQWWSKKIIEVTWSETNASWPISCQTHSKCIQKERIQQKRKNKASFCMNAPISDATRLCQMILISNLSWLNQCIVNEDPRVFFCIYWFFSPQEI